MFKPKVLVSVLLIFMLFLASCTDSENPEASQPEISSAFEATEFPKIPIENLVVATTSVRYEHQSVEHSIPKEKAEMLANFINKSTFVGVDEAEYALKDKSVPYFILYFHYEDKTKISVIVSDYYQNSLCEGHFLLKSDSITDYMTFIIGVDPFHFNKVYED